MHGVRRDEGFGLVEVIIAMLLLAIIAVAIMPALWQGIRFSTEQSSVATATRHMNSLVETIRAAPSCSALLALDDPGNVTSDGSGRTLTPRFNPGGGPVCASGSTVTFTLEIVDQSNVIRATTTAIVYMP